MTTIAFLSQDSMEGYVCDDGLALEPLAERDIKVETVSWRSDQDWSRFAAAIVRSTWDYQRYPSQFFQRLRAIDAATRLANSLDLMQWNMDKRYLAELAREGVATVPTVFGEGLAPGQLAAMIEALDEPHIIKPAISANAERTYPVQPGMPAEEIEAISAAHASSVWMWQPFLNNILSEGEYSLFYFNGALSHSIVKVPKSGDFRVQEEHGGDIVGCEPAPDLLQAADAVMAALDAPPLYARVDLVRSNRNDGWQLIELELIEPALYFRTATGAADRFAASVADWLKT